MKYEIDELAKDVACKLSSILDKEVQSKIQSIDKYKQAYEQLVQHIKDQTLSYKEAHEYFKETNMYMNMVEYEGGRLTLEGVLTEIEEIDKYTLDIKENER